MPEQDRPMQQALQCLEDKIISVATENKKEAESKAEPQESQSVPQAEKKMVDTVAVPQNMQAVANGICFLTLFSCSKTSSYNRRMVIGFSPLSITSLIV